MSGLRLGLGHLFRRELQFRGSKPVQLICDQGVGAARPGQGQCGKLRVRVGVGVRVRIRVGVGVGVRVRTNF